MTSTNGRAIVPEGHEHSLGAFNMTSAAESIYARSDLMIVVGSRGRGVFTGAVLSSVSLNLIKVATVPVLVVNAPAEE